MTHSWRGVTICAQDDTALVQMLVVALFISVTPNIVLKSDHPPGVGHRPAFRKMCTIVVVLG
jgi:hypothetical protein